MKKPINLIHLVVQANRQGLNRTGQHAGWIAALTAALSGCGARTDKGNTGSETHWLDECKRDAECGAQSCLCESCTRGCSSDVDCRVGNVEAHCVANSDLKQASTCDTDTPSRVCAAPSAIATSFPQPSGDAASTSAPDPSVDAASSSASGAGPAGGDANTAGNGSAGENAAAGTSDAGGAGAPVVGCLRGDECTVDLAIDDDIGSYCATKADGTYRCWQESGAVENTLPEEHYRRVLLSRAGLVGLTSSGRILVPPGAAEPLDPHQSVVDIQTTNMWGFTSVCTLDENGVAAVNSGIDSVEKPLDSAFDEPREIPGRFWRSLCAWEGLTAGIQTDRSVVMLGEASLPGNDYTDLAFSLAVLCGLHDDGSITCGPSYFTERCTAVDQNVTCVAMPVPAFADTGWLDVAAALTVACAIQADGELFCQHVDGTVLLRDAGPYVRVEAGKNIVCALRTEGTTACFSHEGGDLDFFAAMTLKPLPMDPGW